MFTTKVVISPSTTKITYNDKIMTIGSCFAQNVGNKLNDAFFQILINPFGVLYNPLSVCNSLNTLLHEKTYDEKDVFEHQALWSSFSHSSLFSGSSSEACLNKINQSSLQASLFLKNTRFLLITLGTAWVYEDVNGGSVVSNCHKLPTNHFKRRRLNVEEIVGEFVKIITKLHSQKIDLEVIFTVSPIRHWKDGAHENNISKSILHLAVEEIIAKLSFVHYFPAYEIQLDELRDYRYYASDMLHPSVTAIDYIWERFAETYFDNETLVLKKELELLRSDLNHRPLHPHSAEYQLFLRNIEKRKAKLLEKYPPLGTLL